MARHAADTCSRRNQKGQFQNSTVLLKQILIPNNDTDILTLTKLDFSASWTSQITFNVLVKVLMSVGPGEDLNFLKREFEEFIKGLICLPIKFPGTRLYKSLKVNK